MATIEWDALLFSIGEWLVCIESLVEEPSDVDEPVRKHMIVLTITRCVEKNSTSIIQKRLYWFFEKINSMLQISCDANMLLNFVGHPMLLMVLTEVGPENPRSFNDALAT